MHKNIAYAEKLSSFYFNVFLKSPIRTNYIIFYCALTIKMRALFLCFSIISVFCLNGLNAQTYYGDQLNSGECLHLLKEGALLIRLDMKTRTIEAYQEELKNNSLSDKYRESTKKRLDDLIEGRASYKKIVQKAFGDYYNFSKVYFIENQHLVKFKNNEESLAFDKDGIYVGPQDIGEHFIMVQGINDHNWIIQTKNFETLPAGFPDEYNSGIKRILNLFTGVKDANQEDMNKVAIKINERLHKAFLKQKKGSNF